MPIDASIYQGIKPIQIDSPVNALSQVLQVQALQRQNALGDMQMQEQRAVSDERNGLRQFFQGNPNLDDAGVQSKLYGVAPTQAGGILKSLAEQKKAAADVKKTEADTRKADVESSGHALTAYRSMLSLVRSPDDFLQWVDGLYSNPATATVAKQFGSPEQVKSRIPSDPAQFQQFLQMNAMGMDDFIKNQTTIRGQDLTAKTTMRGQDMTAASAKEGHQVTMRGQNMTDARARELAQIQRDQPKGQFLETPDGYVLADPRANTVQPVMQDGKQIRGKSADRALTDSQAKANLFGTRMQESGKIITSLEGKYSPAAVNAKTGAENLPVVGGIAGFVGNQMLSDDSQKVEQAQRDFINAVLRRESGAVISDQEFENARKQYFPQPGNPPAVIEQKRRSRELATKLMLEEVPDGKRGIQSQQAPSAVPNKGGAPGAPQPGTVESGYRFRGGNPSDPKNWEKV